MAIKIKKASKFSDSFRNYDGGFYQDEKCCSNKTSMDTDHGFSIIYFFKFRPFRPSHRFLTKNLLHTEVFNSG